MWHWEIWSCPSASICVLHTCQFHCDPLTKMRFLAQLTCLITSALASANGLHNRSRNSAAQNVSTGCRQAVCSLGWSDVLTWLTCSNVFSALSFHRSSGPRFTGHRMTTSQSGMRNNKRFTQLAGWSLHLPKMLPIYSAFLWTTGATSPSKAGATLETPGIPTRLVEWLWILTILLVWRFLKVVPERAWVVAQLPFRSTRLWNPRIFLLLAGASEVLVWVASLSVEERRRFQTSTDGR